MVSAVLIVEDDSRIGEAFARAIQSTEDLSLAGLARDLSSLQSMLDLGCVPDVLLLDLGLPDGNALPLIHGLARRFPACEIVVVTVMGDHESILASIRAGAAGYLLKDTSIPDIVSQIRLLLAGGSPISPSIARKVLQWIGGKAMAPGEGTPELSPQEGTVLRYCAKGYHFDEIAALMNVSNHTVGTYVKRVYRKLKVHSKTEAVYEARKLGLFAD